MQAQCMVIIETDAVASESVGHHKSTQSVQKSSAILLQNVVCAKSRRNFVAKNS